MQCKVYLELNFSLLSKKKKTVVIAKSCKKTRKQGIKQKYKTKSILITISTLLTPEMLSFIKN